MEMYAERKGWDIGAVEVEVDVEYESYVPARLRRSACACRPTLDDEQRQRLLTIAAKCPVHKVLAGETKVVVSDRIEAL